MMRQYQGPPFEGEAAGDVLCIPRMHQAGSSENRATQELSQWPIMSVSAGYLTNLSIV